MPDGLANETDTVFSQSLKDFLPGISIDTVIFGFHNKQLRVLLLKWKNASVWSLPGGFIQEAEHIDQSAIRILHQRTHLADIYLRQFFCFGSPERKRDEKETHLIKTLNLAQEIVQWFSRRFISIGYYALVEYSEVKPQPDTFSESCDWYELDQLPNLMLDHQHIIEKALEALRNQVITEPLGINLLPHKFTMPDLQSLYETLLGRKIDRRNFRRKMLQLGFLEQLEERKTGTAHKAPLLYQFNRGAYEKARVEKIHFGL